MISVILGLLSAVVTVYTILCFIDIILTWFPGAKFTSFGKFISRLCDPYLNFFARWGWTRIGNIDFSPIISIGLLSLLSSILSGVISTGRIRFGAILSSIISLVWNLCFTLLIIMFLIILVRWIVLKVNHGRIDYNSVWTQIDAMIQRFCYKVSYTFTKKNMSYINALLVNWIVFLVTIIIGSALFGTLSNLCERIPF